MSVTASGEKASELELPSRPGDVATSGLAVIAADAMETIYHPLEDPLQCTRLLTFSRAAHGEIICFLEHVQLANLPEYTALSYCWGSCDDTRSVFVHGIERQVTRNLYDALERLHHMQISRLWVDALCINQEDNQERGHQVQLMKLIYSRAKSVIAWIGKSSADSSQAMAALRRMPSKSSRARDTIWEKLENLFARPYWKRIWIIQELAVATEVKVACGRDWVMWEELGAANKAYERRLVEMALDKTNYSYIKNISHFRKKIRDRAPISLLEAMSNSQQALSSVPHDKVFALLGLCQDGTSLVPAPNYEQPVEELLQDLTRKFIVAHSSLDFILAADSSAMPNSALPSWTPNWLGTWNPSADKLQTLSLKARQNFYFETEGSHPHSLKVRGMQVATACSWSPHAWRIWTPPGFYGGSMDKILDAICEALFCDCYPFIETDSRGQDENALDVKALELEQPLLNWFNSARHFLSNLATPGHNRSELRQAIHTIHLEEHPICSSKRENPWLAEEEPWVRHLCFHPSYTLDYELKAFNEVMSWLDEVLDIRNDDAFRCVSDQRPLVDIEDRAQEADLMEYSSEIARSTIRAARERRVLLETEKGRIAIANAQVEYGDLICQLQGCSELVILRQVQENLAMGDHHRRYHELVGKVHLIG